MTSRFLAPCLVGAALACMLPPAAAGDFARTAKAVHLRAGPGRTYPIVAVLPPGLGIDVQGCVGDYSWCDVIAGPSRGWVYAGNIVQSYQGGEVPVLTYGQALGIAIVSFVIVDYWNDFYRDRPWYRDRDHYHWNPPPRHRPPPVPPGPPRHLPPPRTAPPHGVPPGAPPHGTPPGAPPHGVPPGAPPHRPPPGPPSHGVPRPPPVAPAPGPRPHPPTTPMPPRQAAPHPPAPDRDHRGDRPERPDNPR